MSEPRTMSEAYLSATMSSNLRLNPERVTDADRLLAAAYASKDSRHDLALRVWRIRATGTMQGAHALAEDLGALMRSQSMRKRGGYLRTGVGLTFGQAKGVAMTVLKWWQHPTCRVCGGHGHPKMLNAPVLDTNVECPACHGTGKVPLTIRQEYGDGARWVISEMESLSAMVWDDMARRLKQQMDF